MLHASELQTLAYGLTDPPIGLARGVTATGRSNAGSPGTTFSRRS